MCACLIQIACLIEVATKTGFTVYTVNSRYLKVEAYPKLLIFHSTFSGHRKFTLRYQ